MQQVKCWSSVVVRGAIVVVSVGLPAGLTVGCKGEPTSGAVASSSVITPAPVAPGSAATAASAEGEAARPAAIAAGATADNAARPGSTGNQDVAATPAAPADPGQAAPATAPAAGQQPAGPAAAVAVSGPAIARGALRGALNADAQVIAINVGGGIGGMTTDAGGNVFVIDDGKVKKLNAELKEVWSTKPADANVSAIAATTGGEVYFTAAVSKPPEGKTNIGSGMIALGKLSKDGKVAWVEHTGSSQKFVDAGKYVHVATDGSVVFAGEAGQLPGQPPPPSAMALFAMRYTADGQRTWVTQAMEVPASHWSSDAAGNLYGVPRGWLQGFTKINGNGSVGWRKVPPANDRISTKVQAVAPTPGGDGLYWLAGETGCVLQRIGADGSTWFRSAETEKVVVEPVEQVTWNGSMGSCDAILTTNDAVYVSGSYVNRYQNGSSPRPVTANSFVARYDLEGNRVWFKQVENPGMPIVAGSSIATVRGARFLSPNRAGVMTAATGTGFVFAVKTADGSPLALFAPTAPVKTVPATAPAAAPAAAAGPPPTPAAAKAAPVAANPAPEEPKKRRKREP